MDPKSDLKTLFACIGTATVFILVILGIAFILQSFTNTGAQTQAEITPAVTPVPLLTPAITPVPTTSLYPYEIVFTALSCTLTHGKYQITTTDGRVLDATTYAEWDVIQPRGIYSAIVTDSQWGDLIIQNVRTIYQPDYEYRYYRYPQYYHYQGSYYQWDGRQLDPMTKKQIVGEYIIEGLPPGYSDDRW